MFKDTCVYGKRLTEESMRVNATITSYFVFFVKNAIVLPNYRKALVFEGYLAHAPRRKSKQN
jgi:hypothetical protein